MYRLDREPTRLDLRLFGASLSLLFTVLGSLLWFHWQARTAGVVLWVLAAVLCVTYYACQSIQKPLYRAWITLMFPAAWLMSALVLGILYFGLVTPIGWMTRLAGRDPLQRRPPREGTYWIARPPGSPPKSRYFRQY